MTVGSDGVRMSRSPGRTRRSVRTRRCAAGSGSRVSVRPAGCGAGASRSSELSAAGAGRAAGTAGASRSSELLAAGAGWGWWCGPVARPVMKSRSGGAADAAGGGADGGACAGGGADAAGAGRAPPAEGVAGAGRADFGNRRRRSHGRSFRRGANRGSAIIGGVPPRAGRRARRPPEPSASQGQSVVRGDPGDPGGVALAEHLELPLAVVPVHLAEREGGLRPQPWTPAPRSAPARRCRPGSAPAPRHDRSCPSVRRCAGPSLT